jgi:SOS-response transcriptional repressor LexA
MTTRERVYQAIVTHIDQHGMSPTIREMQEAVNVSSVSIIQHHLKALERDGRIIRHPWKARSIEVPGVSESARSGRLIAQQVIDDAQPSGAGYMVVSGDLIAALRRWVERVAA